jgi:hypothetical protein
MKIEQKIFEIKRYAFIYTQEGIHYKISKRNTRFLSLISVSIVSIGQFGLDFFLFRHNKEHS